MEQWTELGLYIQRPLTAIDSLALLDVGASAIKQEETEWNAI